MSRRATSALDFDPEETGSTFDENATLKADEAARLTGLIALADDSGLEVDALDGRPGLFSARYAGGARSATTSPRRSSCRLAARRAATACPTSGGRRASSASIAIATPDGDVAVRRAAWSRGASRTRRAASNGFGYDPVFVVAGYGGKTSAELPPDEKNASAIADRRRAKALEILKELTR